ncbi:pyruvate kinase [Patescibacteria group bacterium]|nr:pyruvate kinase [Patescibacteria group bacterium]
MNQTKKTKIVATLGPATEKPAIIKKLIEAGVNVFRFNTKHNDDDWHEENIKKVQKVADLIKAPIGILLDLQGPEIRVLTPNQNPLSIHKGELQKFSLRLDHQSKTVCIPQKAVFNALRKGNRFSIEDGFLNFEVVSKRGITLTTLCLDTGEIKNKKGLNLIGKDVELPSLIKQDLERLDLAARNKVDFIALSFTRKAKDIRQLKKVMAQKRIAAHTVAKLENQKGLNNLDEIINEAEVVMIGRGDLGVEVPIEELAHHQKTIIQKCRQARKPMIVATQMLESMINNPAPSRAEATDIANAVYDGTDAVMLSGETAIGNNPVKTVQMMSRILIFNEQKASPNHLQLSQTNETDIIIQAAYQIANQEKIADLKKIIILTETGYTARAISSLRPKLPIIAITPQEKTTETLTMSFGVQPIRATFANKQLLTPKEVVAYLQKKRIIARNEKVLLIHGNHWRQPGQTNTLTITQP